MPNYCYNTIIIKGKQEKIFNFFKGMIAFSHEKKEVSYTYEGYSPITEYTRAAAIDAWGVKWDLEDEPIKYAHIEATFLNNEEVSFVFVTPWGPPDNWIYDAAVKNPDLFITLAYEETGDGLFGVYEFEDGEMISDIRYDSEAHIAYSFFNESIKEISEKIFYIYEEFESAEEVLENLRNDIDFLNEDEFTELLNYILEEGEF